MQLPRYRYRLNDLLVGGLSQFPVDGRTVGRDWLVLRYGERLDLSGAADLVEEELMNPQPDSVSAQPLPTVEDLPVEVVSAPFPEPIVEPPVKTKKILLKESAPPVTDELPSF